MPTTTTKAKTTKAEATKATPTPKPKQVGDRPPVPLPPSVMGLLNKTQVREAVVISTKGLETMIHEGRFPRADKRIGRRPRRSVEMFNQWVRDLDDSPNS